MPPPRVVIVADDLTGAAEIAGIAADCGINATLRRSPGGNAACLAYDTDTRHLSPQQAAARVEAFAAQAPPRDLLYKKTDSVLRGHVALEIAALLRHTGRRRAILLPQNPSKGRVIIDSHYHIAGIPLHQTDFRNDPDHPRTTSAVHDLLANDTTPIACVPAGATLPAEGIIVGAASTTAELDWWAAQVSPNLLPAGGADFFAAILHHRGFIPQPKPVAQPQTPTLIICGSATASSRQTVQQWQAAGLPICAVPSPHDDVHTIQAKIDVCAAAAAQSLHNHGIAILAATHDVDRRHAPAIRAAMAHLVALIGLPHPPRLIIEGGATAAAIVEALGWHEFTVEQSLAPGVVALRPAAHPDTQLIIKPGSYPWHILDTMMPHLPR